MGERNVVGIAMFNSLVFVFVFMSLKPMPPQWITMLWPTSKLCLSTGQWWAIEKIFQEGLCHVAWNLLFVLIVATTTPAIDNTTVCLLLLTKPLHIRGWRNASHSSHRPVHDPTYEGDVGGTGLFPERECHGGSLTAAAASATIQLYARAVYTHTH